MQPQPDVVGVDRRLRQVGDDRADGDDLDAARLVAPDEAAVVGPQLAGELERAEPRRPRLRAVRSAEARLGVPGVEDRSRGGDGRQTGGIRRKAAAGAVTATTLPSCRPARTAGGPGRRLGSAPVTTLPPLDLSADVLTLTRALVDAPSVSGSEEALADAVEAALRGLGGLEVERLGNNVLARTNLDRPTRVVLAGHLDTVPIADNVPSELREADGVQRLYGCGTSDMKSGDAVMLRLAGRFGVPGAEPALRPHVRVLRQRGGRARPRTASAGSPARSAAGSTAISPSSWSRRTARSRPAARARCGRVSRSRAGGRTARAAGSAINAIHGLTGAILAALAAYRPREVEIDGCTYREGSTRSGSRVASRAT